MPNPAATGVQAVDRSGATYDLTGDRWRGDDGSPLMLAPMPAPTPDTIDTGERSLWRYACSLPVAPDHRVSLGEGWTPLVPLDWKGHQVLTGTGLKSTEKMAAALRGWAAAAGSGGPVVG